jgi:lipopolysaccharide/colanic/teichoic acid biosynthesis glycosyltransferase
MVVDSENKGGFSTAINDSRFTSVGRKLRRYKLDELPQFINVIQGDMSIVGPRPQVYYYTDKYVGEQILILSVKPGITDLASLYFSDMDKILGDGDVDSKYEIEVEPIKNKLRLKYVKQRSLLLDIRIMIETAFTVFDIKNVTGLDIAE